MHNYFAITESALDLILMHNIWNAAGLPMKDIKRGLGEIQLSNDVKGFFTSENTNKSYFALIETSALNKLIDEGIENTSDIYRRIARVLKGLKNPPIHLPRLWSEYHHRNMVTFFALPRRAATFRWIADTDGELNCVRFSSISSTAAQVDLNGFTPPPWPANIKNSLHNLKELKAEAIEQENIAHGLSTEIDLQVIGSGSVVQNRTYEDWMPLLSDSQKSVLSHSINSSMRMIGPAGSGKTLALCLKAVQISRNSSVLDQGKKILIATHSWAMAERIDGILSVLCGGSNSDHIIVFPLLSLLQMHAGHIGQQRTEIIGDDSTNGRIQSIEIIKNNIATFKFKRDGLSDWIIEGLNAPEDSRPRLDLLFNLYEEISGVLTASSVALDDPESIKNYLNGSREDWMPPFSTVTDRSMVLGIFRDFIRILIDSASITTDQFVLDSIRVLETFTWRMRKETDGYDYILVDELQLFDSQERSALELLGRSRLGVPFITSEDPSQGVFSGLHSKRSSVANDTVYLDTVHRFDKGVFDLISFIYQRFPLNTLPLRIDASKANNSDVPNLYTENDAKNGVKKIVRLADKFYRETCQDARICIATLGDVDDKICEYLNDQKIIFTRLRSFDDVEQLSYSKRSVIVAPWQYIGGTQFSHVIVAAIDILPALTAFSKRHELTALYLACSRATRSLNIVCSSYVPHVIRDAKDQKFVRMVDDPSIMNQ